MLPSWVSRRTVSVPAPRVPPTKPVLSTRPDRTRPVTVTIPRSDLAISVTELDAGRWRSMCPFPVLARQCPVSGTAASMWTEPFATTMSNGPLCACTDTLTLSDSLTVRALERKDTSTGPTAPSTTQFIALGTESVAAA